MFYASSARQVFINMLGMLDHGKCQSPEARTSGSVGGSCLCENEFEVKAVVGRGCPAGRRASPPPRSTVWGILIIESPENVDIYTFSAKS